MATDELRRACEAYGKVAASRRRAVGRVREAELELERALSDLQKAERALGRADRRRRRAGWTPPPDPVPHEWQFEDGEKGGEAGTWMFCLGCGALIFLEKNDRSHGDFYRRIKAALHFCFLTMDMPDRFVRSMSDEFPEDSPYFPGQLRGLHGRMSEDCSLARRIPDMVARLRPRKTRRDPPS